jgi:hypothetical protein
MILNFDETNPGYGNVPVMDGTFWRARPTQIFSQVTPVTLTAAATASVVSTANAAGSPTLNANALNRLGATLVVKFGGYATTPGSAAGNLTFGIYLGGSCVATTPATAFAVSQTKIGYYGECRLTCISIGSSGTIQATGVLCLSSLSAVLDPAFTNGSTIGTQAPQTPSTVNFTTSLLVDVQSVLSAATDTLVHTNTTVEIVF